mmetsp:Transcript_39854/g.98573  ORF Transcript_39854/g.98573 Transcript_39854/m.98573 type:complete len:899 (+) Transcript_39854:109-2805(+)
MVEIRYQRRGALLGAALLLAGTAAGTPPTRRVPSPPRTLGTARRQFVGTTGATLAAALALPVTPATASTAPVLAQGDGFVWMPLERRVAREQYPPRFVTYLARCLLRYDGMSRRWWEVKAREAPLSFSADRVRELRLEHYGEFTRSVELGLDAEYSGPKGVASLVQLLRQVFTSAAERRQLALLLTLLPPATQPVNDITELLGETDNATISRVLLTDGGAGYDDHHPPLVTISAPFASAANGKLGAPAELRAIVLRGKVEAIEVVNRGCGYSYLQPLEVTIAPPPKRTASPNNANNDKTASTAASAANATAAAANSATIPNATFYGNAAAVANATAAPEQHLPASPPRRATASAELDAREGRTGLTSISSWLPETATSVALTTLLPEGTPIVFDPKAKVYRIGPKVVAGTSGAAASSGAGGAGGSGGGKGGGKQSATSMRTSPFSPADIAQETARGSLTQSWLRLPEPPRPYAVFDPVFGPIGRSPVEKQASLDASQYARLAFSGALCSALGHAILTPLDVVKTSMQADPQRFNQGVFGTAKKLVHVEARAFVRNRRKVAADELLARPQKAAPSRSIGSVDGGTRGGALGAAKDARAGGGSVAPKADKALVALMEGSAAPIPGGEEEEEEEGSLNFLLLPTGLNALFRGVDASAAGHFISGGIGFGTTEFCRRFFLSAIGPERALIYPPALTVISASIVGVIFATIGVAPFEAARVKMVKGGDTFAPNFIEGISRIAREDGASSFYGPKFRTLLLKDVPYAMVKFASYDAFKTIIYAAVPSLSESLRSSLVVSLVAGFLAGVSAATFSHPADTIFTRLNSRDKEAPGAPPVGPLTVAREMLEAGGPGLLYAGVGARAVFSGLLLAIEFLIYDAVRTWLHVGAEDLQLFMDVLAGVRGE